MPTICVDSGSPWSFIPSQEHFRLRSEDPLCINFVRRQLHDCLALQGRHRVTQVTTCDKKPHLPHYTIKILASERIHLHESHCERNDYLTLSHRWSTEAVNLSTTTANQKLHKKEIPWKQLNQTFKDAVSLTISLGYKYI